MQPELFVTMMPTSDLVPYAGNAKEHPDWQVGQIAASIEQFGFNDPVGIWHNPDGDPVIVEGHGRVLAAKMLGIESLPTVTLDHLDDEGRRAYTLAHNKLTTNTGYDQDMLGAELDAIENIDMSEFGFDSIAFAEQFGTDFQLPDGDGPAFKTISLHLTQEQFEIINEAVAMVDDCSTDGGNDMGRKIAEVCRLWARL